MMGDNTKLMMTGLIGAAFGGLLTYVLMKDRIREEAEEEIEAMREYYQDMVKDVEEDYFEEMKGLVEELDDEERLEGKYTDYTKKYLPDENEDFERGQSLVRPKKVVREVPEPTIDIVLEEEELDDPDYEGDPHEDEYEYDEPYVISKDDFENSFTHLEKITMSYYDHDDILADENDEAIPNPISVVGDALVRFGEESGDKNIVYVRNPELEIDYEVVRMNDSFQERILGFRGEY